MHRQSVRRFQMLWPDRRWCRKDPALAVRIPRGVFINVKPGSNRERVEDLQLVHFSLYPAWQPLVG
jgi:hypothetical protein